MQAAADDERRLAALTPRGDKCVCTYGDVGRTRWAFDDDGVWMWVSSCGWSCDSNVSEKKLNERCLAHACAVYHGEKSGLVARVEALREEEG